ncbi:MAG: hypothetical protein R3C10_21265 [Pirellulales bacterium]
MSLKARLDEALGGIAHFATGTRHCQATDRGRRLSCELAALDKLACSLSHLELTSDELSGVDADGLRRIADRLSARLTYLLEPIAPTELDRDQCVVQLRSVQPSREGEANTYYELMVRRGGEIALERYSAEPGEPRTAIPAQLTRQVLNRLVGDFEVVLETLAK